jgi:hypothetical protein
MKLQRGGHPLWPPPHDELRRCIYKLLINIEICVAATSWYLRPVSLSLLQAPCVRGLVVVDKTDWALTIRFATITDILPRRSGLLSTILTVTTADDILTDLLPRSPELLSTVDNHKTHG